MKATTADQSRHVCCAEDISFLHLLHEVPEQPSVGTPPDSTQNPGIHALSAALESSLAGSLAFLSSITNSPNDITAVCVQERREQDRIDVLVAINKEKHRDGNDVLNRICGALSTIFERLSRPTEDECERDVFHQIVALCKVRILDRLVSKGSKNTVDKILQQARDSLVTLEGGGDGGMQLAKVKRYQTMSASLTPQIAAFLDKSTNALRLIREWRLHQEDARLCAAIEGLRDLSSAGKLAEVIDLIPNHMMDPSTRSSLLNMIRKVSRYRDVARILYRAAKKVPIARRMHAVAVQLPQYAFQRVSAPSTGPSLQDTTGRILVNQRRDSNTLNRLCQIKGKKVRAASGEFDTQVQKTLQEGKFHAEVQLLYHVLANPSATPPRFICSSKDACFLCNLLIQVYGKIQTRRCHGRLYPGWRLPLSPEFMALQTAMNVALESKIGGYANTLLNQDRSQRIIHPYPCESSCSTAVLSETTVAVQASEISNTNPIVEAALNDGPADNSTTSSETTSTPSTVIQRSEPHSMMQEAGPATTQPPLSIRQSYALAQGEVISSSLDHDSTSELYTSELFEVQLEYTTTEVVGVADRTPKLSYRIQQLNPQEAKSARDTGSITIIDAMTLYEQNEQTYKLDEMTDLYLGVGDCIFRLTLDPASHSDKK